MKITIDGGSGTASVGEIALGKRDQLGTTIPGTEDGFESLSTVERDVYGNITIVPRGSFDTVLFRLAIPVGDEGRVKRLIRQNKDRPALYYADEDLLGRGLIVYGTPQLQRIPMAAAGVSEASIEVQGLV